VPPELADVAVAQDGIVRRDQLRRADPALDRGRVRRELAGERWAMPARNVIALHNGPLTRHQSWHVAVAAHGTQLAALAGLTAAEAHGLQGFETTLIHVLVPRGARVQKLAGVKVHESRRFTASDLHPTRQPAMVTVERAVIDAATWSPRPRRACAIVAAAVQQRLTTPERLADCLAGAGQIRHRRLLSAVLLDVAGGAQALSELDLVLLCRAYGLPEPRRQVVRRDRHGRRRWLDAVFDLPDGRELVAEIDGAAHLLVEHYVDDLDRTAELLIDGKVVVRFAAVTLRVAPERVADQLARLLGRPPVGRVRQSAAMRTRSA
jgi:hypothetical protein